MLPFISCVILGELLSLSELWFPQTPTVKVKIVPECKGTSLVLRIDHVLDNYKPGVGVGVAVAVVILLILALLLPTQRNLPK